MDVSVIIVSYNTCELTRDCINSVVEKTEGLEYEIIVVDNASSDSSVKMIKTTFPQVRLVEEKNNWGFGKANNIGAKCAAGEYIFLLNSDTLLVNNAIRILYDFIKKNPTVGMCGGQLVDINGNSINSYGPYPTKLREMMIALFPAAWIKYVPVSYLSTTEINNYLFGADMMINKKYYHQLNGFDTDFFMYSEDIDLSLRFKKAGYSIYFIPDARIIHLVNQSSTESDISNNHNIDRWSYSEERYAKFVFLQKLYGHRFTRLIYYISRLKGEVAVFIFLLLGNTSKKLHWRKYSNIHQKQYLRFLQYYKERYK